MRSDNERQSVTSLPEAPDVERNRRFTNYAIAMGIRTVCVILCFFVQGWWLVLPILGAVILPYVAVVAANARAARPGAEVERPGSIVPLPHESRPL
ncbi:hypothetical protein M2152_001091 [Microbacteriaceae bacterium SG_E_30_P1]|uniref:DUF3099 domain-containing protein n=1 Tax=Antiquaquibacter oligotrophicus TaxID=2880260 RepID=A0ABT6KP09_9MICO|nr:DUF3099 domain-containing protein [Antiquaquibacter oligotrophicus]MDH6180909.1 hypothetical protein [Antiquaquibacter oligotrophicus]UDF13386.1 DUF3099 domain-containing protein [Antiquaquibacter oligotrophicus]